MVRRCEPCLLRRSLPKKEPMIPDNVPDRPWQHISVDKLSIKGREYQLITDYFSKFVELELLPRNPTSYNCIQHIKNVVSRFGLPERLRSDGDPLYMSIEFKNFVKSYDIKHKESSAGYAQSNGFIERHVATIKNMLYKCDDINLALLNYRNTPISNELPSPAKILFNRELRTRIPTCTDLFVTELDRKYKLVLERRVTNMEQHYNKHVQERLDFVPGQFVRYRDNPDDRVWKRGKIIAPRSDDGRSYLVMSQAGNHLLRNKRLLISDYIDQHLTVLQDESCMPTSNDASPSTGAVSVPYTEPGPSNVVRRDGSATGPPRNPPLSPARSLSAAAPPVPPPLLPTPQVRRSSRVRKHKPTCQLSCCR